MTLPVSVVIPSFNRAALLLRTLESIFAQRSPAAEIIVVDDGSTDDTFSVCAGYGDRIRYIHQQNAGLSAARNTGIRASSCEWVALCDSDDLWEPSKLEIQLHLTRAVQADWSATSFHLIDDDDRLIDSGRAASTQTFAVLSETGTDLRTHLAGSIALTSIRFLGSNFEVFSGSTLELLFQGNVVLPSSTLVAKHVFDRVGLFDEQFRVAEETEFFLRAAAATRGAFIDADLTSYRTGGPSIIRSGDTSPLIRNALKSVDRAARLRDLSAGERLAYRRGRERLQLRLAYNRLAALQPREARIALTDGGDVRGSRRGASLFLASFLPPLILRLMHMAKRTLKGGAE